ncbi:MAG: hypothetical protein A2Y17_08760 [Clostridiales bacterium GWF2_38_85]|nr:MAG: hypothetical protein A2Y17_08760 [Clostridiales bacterium GWF2_38_85]
MITIEGTIENIVFSNADNGYTVCRISTPTDLITAVGVMPYIAVGECILVNGTWENHNSYGRQLRIQYYEKQLPKDVGAIYKYLSSGAIKGIGKITAERIVDTYGINAFDVIENNPDWLTSIKGITPKKAQGINDSYMSQYGLRSIMVFCGSYFGPSLSVKIYKKYGLESIGVVKLNPYILSDTINGISFRKADEVAKSLGFEHNSKERMIAGIKNTLMTAAYQNGHCFLPYDKLISTASTLLKVEPQEITEVVNYMLDMQALIAIEVNDEKAIYLPMFAEAERYIAKKLLAISENAPEYKLKNVENEIKYLEKEYNFEYASEQEEAILSAVSNSLTIVTGGPGTGKTTVIKAIISIFQRLSIPFHLAAPTGRAAKRMSEASGCEAATIHRLLEMKYGDEMEPEFGRNESMPLECGALIVDEMSMVDTMLMYSMLRAIKVGTLLVLIGDIDQLPPVGAGQVLRDMIKSNSFSVISLTKIFRQAEESLIVKNAHAINHGEMPVVDDKTRDFFFLERSNNEETQELIIDLVSRRLPQTYKMNNIDDLQVLSPTRKGILGTTELNKRLQDRLNPYNSVKIEKRVGDVIFRTGDKIMQTRNNYDIPWQKSDSEGTGIFNGDIGRILSIDTIAEVMIMDFDGRIAEYDFLMLEEIEHSYAITVHKSQGSEYPFVVIPVFDAPPMLQTRNLLYTAVTRAQKMVVLVGYKESIEYMISNNRITKRYTALRRMLENTLLIEL